MSVWIIIVAAGVATDTESQKSRKTKPSSQLFQTVEATMPFAYFSLIMNQKIPQLLIRLS